MVNQLVKPEVLLAVEELLQTHFATEIQIHVVHFLSDPDRRNVVLRIMLNSTQDEVPASIILKQSLIEKSNDNNQQAYERFARDWAGLEFLSVIPHHAHFVPKFYGASKEHRFILIEDLGHQHISLVDSLTRPNRQKAVAALTRFMKALGNFHATTFNQTKQYETILKRINPNTETFQENLDSVLNDLLPKLKSAHELLNLPIADGLLDEVVDIITTMLSPSPFAVLTHGDICPDNVFDHESRDLQLIDFEWSFVRNALLDGTYLRMSMPTCWCAKAIPNEVIDYLESIYRKELARAIPAAQNDLTYNNAYTKACAFWVLQQTLPLIEGIFLQERIGPSGPVPEDSLWSAEDNTVRPRFVSRLQSFVDIATKNDMLPHLRDMSKSMLVVVEAKWLDIQSLALYPAFATPTCS